LTARRTVASGDATTKTDAIAEQRALSVDRVRGHVPQTGSFASTLAEVIDEWLDHLDLRTTHRDPRKRYSPRTVKMYRQRMNKHVVPPLGSRAITDVDERDLRRLVERLGGVLAPSSVTQIVSMLSSVFTYAKRNGIVERNVVRDLDRDDRPGTKRLTEPRYLSENELRRLLEAMSDTFRPVAAACTYASLRISEALGLRWGDVDFKNKTLRVCRQLDDDGTVRDVTKTPASTATLPLLPALERELRALRNRQAGVDLQRIRAEALVFVSGRGKSQSRRNALRAVHTAGDAVELNGAGVEPVGLHDLRHSFVALALEAGMSLAEVAVLARHANARVTGQLYAGLSDDSKTKLASKLLDAGIGS
jgi:integrase